MTEETQTQEQPKPTKAPPEVRQLLMTQGEIQKLRLLVSQEVAFSFEEAEELKEDAQFYKAEGCKVDAKAAWNRRAKVIRRANSWTDIQKTLKTGGDTPAEVVAAMNARGYTITKLKI